MLSGKRLLLLGFIVVLLVVIPLTVYLVSQQQKLGAGASPQTNISFSLPTVTKAVGELVTEDINITTGGNEVSFIKLTINFDPAKLEPTAIGATLCPAHPEYVICPSALFPNPPLQGPTVSGNSISITLSVGSNPTAKISTTVPTKIATVNFKAKEATTTPTQISFAPGDLNQVLSIASGDQFNENVLAGNPQPANVTITSSGATPTPTATPGGATGAGNKVPVCTALNLDKSPTGTAPYTINFTAIGNDPDGTITKVTFNWGDGPTQDVTNTTTGGGIGTASVNTQLVHIYNNPGSYTATAILTDNGGGVSVIGLCTQAITINAQAGGPNSTNQTVTVGGGTTTPSATPITVVTPITSQPQPTLAPTGPGDKIISLGALGIIFSIVGAVIFFAL
ncbi:MAG: cohesin domain-containing protein [Patescibacteria group bacterium]